MQNKVSIIVPVYKVEKYLNNCIRSIVEQTYSNLEVILIDDGSPDGCPQICNEWRQKDTRIKVIHQENLGVSAARNRAIECISGEYILFVDSDDWIANNMVEVLVHGMESSEDVDAVFVDMLKLMKMITLSEKLCPNIRKLLIGIKG